MASMLRGPTGRRVISCYAGARVLEGGTDTLILPDESTVDAAKRIGTLLDYSVLPFRGRRDPERHLLAHA